MAVILMAGVMGGCAGGAGLVGVVEDSAILEHHVAAHVVGGVAEHAGHPKLHLAAGVGAVGGRCGDLPGVEAVVGGGAELDGGCARRGQVDGVLGHLRIPGDGGAGDLAGLDDGDDGGSVVLCVGGQGSGHGNVLALRDGGGRGVIAGLVNGAAAGDGPLDGPAIGVGGGELEVLAGRDGGYRGVMVMVPVVTGVGGGGGAGGLGGLGSPVMTILAQPARKSRTRKTAGIARNG